MWPNDTPPEGMGLAKQRPGKLMGFAGWRPRCPGVVGANSGQRLGRLPKSFGHEWNAVIRILPLRNE